MQKPAMMTCLSLEVRSRSREKWEEVRSQEKRGRAKLLQECKQPASTLRRGEAKEGTTMSSSGLAQSNLCKNHSDCHVEKRQQNYQEKESEVLAEMLVNNNGSDEK